MKFLRRLILGAGMFALLAQPAGMKADETNTPPDFKEVYDLIRAHLAGETEADLDRDAVQGLLIQLHSKVSLDSGPTSANGQSKNPPLAKSSIYDGPIGYLRIGRVSEGLASQFTSAYQELNSNNRLKGIVLDLRFADGHDYAQAAAVADLFVNKDSPLLDWGNGVVRAKAKSDVITLPVAVLVNQKTAAAAEALAAILREDAHAVILGGNTAGEATIDQEFPLKNGQNLRVATSAVKLGNGETLSAGGVAPDIQVAVNSEDEKAYYADPFKEISKPSNLLSSLGAPESRSVANENGVIANNSSTSTNRVARRSPTEADLIRERKERPGMELEYNVSASREAEAEKPVVRDPVLGRALDLIKGISVLKAPRPS